MLGLGCPLDLASRMAILIISNVEMKFLEKSGLLLKGVGETIKSETK